MTQISDRIKQLRTYHKLTQVDLAAKLNLSKQSISNYETNYASPPTEVLIALANIFNVSTDYLLGRIPDQLPLHSLEQLDNTDALDNMGSVYLPAKLFEQHGVNLIAFEMPDDSMARLIPSGATVVVKKQPEIDSGDIAVIRVNNNSFMCRKVFYLDEKTVVIQPDCENEYYHPEFIYLQQTPLEIVGKVIWCCRDF